MSSQTNSKFREELVALYTELANYVIIKVSQEKCGIDRAMCRAHRGKRSTKQLQDGPNRKMWDKGQLTITKTD
jgi:hypothetical protein